MIDYKILLRLKVVLNLIFNELCCLLVLYFVSERWRFITLFLNINYMYKKECLLKSKDGTFLCVFKSTCCFLDIHLIIPKIYQVKKTHLCGVLKL